MRAWSGPVNPDRQALTLSRLQERIDHLPLLPDVVIALLRLDARKDDYFDKVVALVHADPAFATRLLRYANSAAIAPTRPVTTLERALLMVGCEGAVGLVVAHSAARVFVPRHEWERALWRHAFDVACLTQTLAPHVTGAAIDSEQAYLFGLLHDIGRFILYLEAPEDLRAIDETGWETPKALIDAERAVCGFTHAELGYLAMRKWRLPHDLALAVRYHHSPQAAAAEVDAAGLPLVALLQDTDWISVELALRADLWRTLSPAELGDLLKPPKLRTRFSIAQAELTALVRQALDRSAEMQNALGLG